MKNSRAIEGSDIKKNVAAIYSHTGLRGLAAMYVVLYHFSLADKAHQTDFFHKFFSFGGYSVDLFFILSGFILNWVYLPNTAPINWPTYLWARVARILPLYYLTTLVMMPLYMHDSLAAGASVKSLIHDLFLNGFLVSGIMDGWAHTFNSPAWSISVEFFCYLAVFPLLYWLKKWLTAQRYALVTLLILAVVCTQGLVFCYGVSPVSLWHSHRVWDCKFLLRGIFGFAAGFCLCSIYQMRRDWKPSLGLINLAVLLPVSIFLLVGFGGLPGQLVQYAFPVLVFFSAMDQGIAASVLKTKFFQWLGERSYSIYLWHPSLLGKYTVYLQDRLPEGVYFVVSILLILGIAELSYRFIESPVRNYIRQRWQNKTVR